MTAAELAAAFAALPAALDRNMATLVRMAGDKAVTLAKTEHTYRDRTSLLTNSIAFEGPTGSFGTNDLEGVLSAGAPYALFVEEDTAPHRIEPRYRKRLRWATSGGFAFSNGVNHPGTTGTHFMANAAESVIPVISNELAPSAVELSFLQCGFDP